MLRRKIEETNQKINEYLKHTASLNQQRQGGRAELLKPQKLDFFGQQEYTSAFPDEKESNDDLDDFAVQVPSQRNQMATVQSSNLNQTLIKFQNMVKEVEQKFAARDQQSMSPYKRKNQLSDSKQQTAGKPKVVHRLQSASVYHDHGDARPSPSKFLKSRVEFNNDMSRSESQSYMRSGSQAQMNNFIAHHDFRQKYQEDQVRKEDGKEEEVPLRVGGLRFENENRSHSQYAKYSPVKERNDARSPMKRQFQQYHGVQQPVGDLSANMGYNNGHNSDSFSANS